jgi:TonB-dependent SusC/RagA subfamily outer membrane receptor
MRTLRRSIEATSLVVLTCTLAACAGAPVNTSLRPATAALLTAPAVREIESPATPARTFAVGRAEIPPAEAKLYSNLEEMLNGRIAGLEVLRRSDGTYSLRVRGARSFNGDAEPLVVVDGMAYGNGGAADVLAMLSPRDVKRVDVLKDAGATAVYGSRGSNGVVLITTHRKS